MWLLGFVLRVTWQAEWREGILVGAFPPLGQSLWD